MAIKYPDRIESNNPQAYGIVKATEIAGQRLVKQLSDLYKLPDAILSESKTGEDAEGLIWIVGKDLYQLISWQNRNDASGWLKVIPFNEKMFDRFYNLDGNMINSLTGYIKATELLNLLENDSLLNALGKLEYKADLTYDLVTSVYEGVHTIEELREMLKILEEIQNSSEVLNSYLSKYLPLAGGIMSGSIDMNKNSLKNAGFEVVTALPTTNLFNGRQVTYEGKIYTYHNGKWISTADDLGDLKETLSSEFVFRPTADTHSVKDEFASVKSIKGNTVVWNQLRNGKSYSWTTDTVFLKIRHIPQGHKFLLSVDNKTSLNHNLAICLAKDNKDYGLTNSILFGSNEVGRKCAIRTADEDKSMLYIYSYGYKDDKSIDNLQVFDLTQMFGEGNEPATVEEFEKLYSHLPTDYNEGSLLNINADSIKSIGFNLFDKTKVESESYLYYNTGISTYHKGLKESVSDFIRVIPSTKYYVKNIISGDHRTAWVYDSNKIPLTVISVRTTDNIDGKFLASMKITIPDNAHYIRFGIYDEYLDSACINLSHNGERDGEYKPYEEHIVNLPIKKYFPDGLKSAGAVYDEIIFDKNIGKYKAIQRIGSVDMGTLNWTYNDGSSNPDRYPYGYFTFLINNIKAGTYMLTPYYTYMNNAVVGFKTDKSINNSQTSKTSYLIDSSYTDADSLKASLQGQILYYELAEPIETIIEDYDLIAYKANDWGTEEIISEEPTTPIKTDIEYNFDATNEIVNHIFEIKKLNKKIDELTALVESLLTTLNVNYEKVEN